MSKPTFEEVVEALAARDARYALEAYFFVREGLDYAQKTITRPGRGHPRHVSAGELLEGLRRHALQQYGPLARTVLEAWGVRTTADFGALVFRLIEAGVFSKTEHDRPEDFAGGYGFAAAFDDPFRPVAKPPESAPRAVQPALPTLS
jgi:uncharacterized repeat protein (TIGR04138 family)